MKQTIALFSFLAPLVLSTSVFASEKTVTKKIIKTTKVTTASTNTESLDAPLTGPATAQLTIEGMHCGGCKQIVTKKVCEDAALAPSFESCEVTNLDTKKQVGTLMIKYKKDAKVDVEGIEKAVHVAGEDYKVTKKEIVKKVAN